MRRPAAVLAVCAAFWSSVGVARAADGPRPEPPVVSSAPPSMGADQIEFAAREHDLGYRAYIQKQYDEAASHFENAFFAAPNPAELRSAVRARRDAGELARAATLAALGQRRFPDDPVTQKVAAEVVAEARPRVYEIEVSSAAEYTLAIDEKVVIAQRSKEARVFVNPGLHELLVSWSDDRNARVSIDAREGGSESLQLEPPPPAPPPIPPPPPAPPPPAVVPPPAAPSASTRPAPAEARPLSASKPFGPSVVVVGAALTAVAGGFTIWSGIATEKTPGTSTVLQKCVGIGPACHDYQDGRSAQLRTNILIATTAGLGVATAVVGAFFTQWSKPVVTPGAAMHPLTLTPLLGIGQAGVAGAF